MRSDGVEAILLDMGGVLVPEVPGYANAAIRWPSGLNAADRTILE